MKIGIVFPGQGSQSSGMLADLAASFSTVKQVFEQASDALGKDLWALVQQQDATELNQTENTQPAMLTADMAIYRVWLEQGGAAGDLMAGHSLGEYAALVAAGSLSLEDAVPLVALRGQLMQQAVPAGSGAMAAILGLNDDQVIAACQQASQDEVVAAVNFNAPGQVVIAGQRSAVERAIELAKQAGAKRAILLPVSVPSHCELMRPAAEKLAQKLAEIEIKAPQIPVFHNINADSSDDPETIRHYLIEQLHQPVLWVKTIQNMKQAGLDYLLECGPGKVLSNLSKRIDKSLPCLPVFDAKTLQQALEKING